MGTDENILIEDTKKIDFYECLTGNIQMNKMTIPDGNDLYFVAFCKNGSKAKGEYFASLGAARLRFEILKTKII